VFTLAPDLEVLALASTTDIAAIGITAAGIMMMARGSAGTIAKRMGTVAVIAGPKSSAIPTASPVAFGVATRKAHACHREKARRE
jgi:hypothetical protein